MRHRNIIFFLLSAILLTVAPLKMSAQFREGAFNQNYNSDKTADVDTTDYTKISVRNIFGGLSGKHDLTIGNMTVGNILMPGSAQIYNHQAWKLGIFYPVLAATLGGGIWCNMNGHQDISPYLFAGAALTYWSMQFDAAYNYKKEEGIFPGRATVYALLCPGLGQAVNGEYWKIPVYHGVIITSFSLYLTNANNYARFRRIYIESTDPGYTGTISGETALYYRNTYRRLRDYCILGMVAGYLLQIIDANVFAYMGGFEMSDDISLRIAPTLTMPSDPYTMPYTAPYSSPYTMPLNTPTPGLALSLNF